MGLNRLLSIFALLAIPQILLGQETLQRLQVTQSTSEARGTVFVDHPDKAGLIIESPITTLRFDSNMGGIVEERHQPDQGRYILIIEPFTQIISIDAPGYIQGRIRVASPSAREVFHYKVEPEARTADLISVVFSVQPADARLFLDGQQTEINETIRLQPGNYDLRLEREGFRIIEDAITVSSDQILFPYQMDRVSPEEVWFTTIPARAFVRINDMDLGQTDANGAIAAFYHPGDYIVDITASGYGSIRQVIEVREGAPNEFTFELERNAGTLQLNLQPQDAQVELNRRRFDGSAPIDLTPGLYRLEVTKSGFHTYLDDIRIERNQTLTLDVSLERQTGSLLYSVSPASARTRLIDEDGNEVDTWTGIRQMQRLGTGMYEVVASAPGYAQHREFIVISDGETTEIRVVLNEGDDQTIARVESAQEVAPERGAPVTRLQPAPAEASTTSSAPTFDRFALSLFGGTTSIFEEEYVAYGASFQYYLTRGLRLGASVRGYAFSDDLGSTGILETTVMDFMAQLDAVFSLGDRFGIYAMLMAGSQVIESNLAGNSFGLDFSDDYSEFAYGLGAGAEFALGRLMIFTQVHTLFNDTEPLSVDFGARLRF